MACRRLLESAMAVFGVAAILGCSAEGVDVPEPDVSTPGAIVGMQDDDSEIFMFRTQGTTGAAKGDPILIVDLFQAQPRTFEEARALARGPELPVRTHSYFITLRTVVTNRHEVLWFRSLAPH
jgi:hypothetical protein